MIEKPASQRLPQLPLFILEESIGNVELFPTVWGAVEDLTMSDIEIRRSALDRLVELNAPRYSPIVSYVIATRLTDPDIPIRSKVVQTLGEILTFNANGHPAPDDVRNSLTLYLSQLRTRQVFSLLQVAANDTTLERYVARLLDACPYAGNHLVDILGDPKAPIEVRKQAANMIGQVGFLDALPALDRISGRLIARLEGQSSMPFAPPPHANETDLLPAVQVAINRLRAP